MRVPINRWFTVSEIGELCIRVVEFPASAIVTAALAHNLNPSGSALGQVVY